MSRRFNWLFVLLMCGLAQHGHAADDVSAPEMVFLLIGQSNMAGRAHLQPGDSDAIEGVLLLNGDGKWEPAASPLNRYSNVRKGLDLQRIGPGDGFARAVRKARPHTSIGLIVNARGGSSIRQWAREAQLYRQTLDRLQSVPNHQLAGVVWHQGESDANDPAYLEKLTELVANLRADLKSPQLPFVAGEVFGNRPVNQHIRNLPSKLERTAAVSAAELTVFDGVHFDRESQHTLGRRYAEAMLKLLPASD